jgi:hypothetical protein
MFSIALLFLAASVTAGDEADAQGQQQRRARRRLAQTQSGSGTDDHQIGAELTVNEVGGLTVFVLCLCVAVRENRG